MKSLLQLWKWYWGVHEPEKTMEEKYPWLVTLEKSRADAKAGRVMTNSELKMRLRCKRGVCAPTVETHDEL